MRYLLDTNVVSELRKGGRANPGVRAWFESVADEDLCLSVMVIGELRQGVKRVRRRDPDGAVALERWLAGIVRRFADRILVVDADVADLWGRLNVPDPLPAVDGLLAATALTHDLLLVTRNTADVAPSGVSVVNPFDPVDRVR